jgi:hypothetical protein
MIGYYPEQAHGQVYAAEKRGEGPQAADPHDAPAVGLATPFFWVGTVEPDGSRRHPGAFFGVRAGRDRGGAEAPIGARFGPMPPEAEATHGAPGPAGTEAGRPGEHGPALRRAQRTPAAWLRPR